MDLKWLKTFITVYEEGSFRAAAEKLYISQPSITVHIKALEEELQVKLFEREHTKVKVTQVGETYYEMAKKILAQIEDTKYEIQQAANNYRIHLVIAIAGNAAIPHVLSTIQSFRGKYPEYDIEIVLDDYKTSDTLLRSHQVDIVISLNKTKSTDLHSEQYITGYMQLMFSERLAEEGLSHDAQLRYLLSMYPLYIGFMNEHAPIIEKLQSEYPIWRTVYVSNDDFVYKLVEKGLALTIAPVFLEKEKGTLNTLGLGGIERIYPIHMYISHVRNNEAIQPLLIFLRNQKTNIG